MSKEVTIIFPNQVFKNNPATANGRKIYLVEEWFYFTQYNFHKQTYHGQKYCLNQSIQNTRNCLLNYIFQGQFLSRKEKPKPVFS